MLKTLMMLALAQTPTVEENQQHWDRIIEQRDIETRNRWIFAVYLAIGGGAAAIGMVKFAKWRLARDAAH